ncbi:MarR family winged helix-turn-helix transcriptional regulator [Acidocella aminolytica]|jgi:DNA-binding MarR family transcriptional regulator|uniref:Transcriptional regulator MarR n=2 Tax=Acidocella TaxID=50709 RepID=A0A0D6PD89_9PROT|nr:MarR family transcriptional regulator [Acidocella aminolytica]GAN78839.1 transcriptional regulator MarR [Acidocella aminolytica 101 = DSM 11237]GBQ33247.1 transcriptional regulator [Acidocella aminolytica 101 = DSM 11237]SHF17419.1 transcriptional regulator, MarR family [Acidocella aminolytica 101 = DSM 11237]
MAPKVKSPVPSEPEDMPPSNPLEQLLGYQLRRASQAMMADLSAALTDLELKITEMSVLMVIEENPDITQSEIGRVLGIQRANMVPLTTQLERRGLIRKGVTTGRAQALRLTPAGRVLMRECRKRVTKHEARFLAGMPKSHRDALMLQLRMVWNQ